MRLKDFAWSWCVAVASWHVNLLFIFCVKFVTSSLPAVSSRYKASVFLFTEVIIVAGYFASFLLFLCSTYHFTFLLCYRISLCLCWMSSTRHVLLLWRSFYLIYLHRKRWGFSCLIPHRHREVIWILGDFNLFVCLKAIVLTQPNIDLMWVADRAVTLWLPAGGGSLQEGNQINYSFHRVDMWIRFMAAVVSKDFAQISCQRAIAHAWPIVYTRLNALFPSIDPKWETVGFVLLPDVICHVKWEKLCSFL